MPLENPAVTYHQSGDASDVAGGFIMYRSQPGFATWDVSNAGTKTRNFYSEPGVPGTEYLDHDLAGGNFWFQRVWVTITAGAGNARLQCRLFVVGPNGENIGGISQGEIARTVTTTLNGSGLQTMGYSVSPPTPFDTKRMRHTYRLRVLLTVTVQLIPWTAVVEFGRAAEPNTTYTLPSDPQHEQFHFGNRRGIEEPKRSLCETLC